MVSCPYTAVTEYHCKCCGCLGLMTKKYGRNTEKSAGGGGGGRNKSSGTGRQNFDINFLTNEYCVQNFLFRTDGRTEKFVDCRHCIVSTAAVAATTTTSGLLLCICTVFFVISLRQPKHLQWYSVSGIRTANHERCLSPRLNA